MNGQLCSHPHLNFSASNADLVLWTDAATSNRGMGIFIPNIAFTHCKWHPSHYWRGDKPPNKPTYSCLERQYQWNKLDYEKRRSQSNFHLLLMQVFTFIQVRHGCLITCSHISGGEFNTAADAISRPTQSQHDESSATLCPFKGMSYCWPKCIQWLNPVP